MHRKEERMKSKFTGLWMIIGSSILLGFGIALFFKSEHDFMIFGTICSFMNVVIILFAIGAMNMKDKENDDEK